jgi:hypothetical protein
VRTANLVTVSVILLLGGIVVVDAVRLGIGWGTDGPKSGFFPFWLAIVLLVTSTLILIQSLGISGKVFVTREQLRPVLTVLLPATAMVLGAQFIGLYVAGALYIGGYMRAVGRHSWILTIAIAIGIPVVTFVVFERWFLVPMPKGPLETWLGL